MDKENITISTKKYFVNKEMYHYLKLSTTFINNVDIH